MEVLKSMTAYVLEQYKKWAEDDLDSHCSANYIANTSNYAKFLSMPLELKYFVPCDDQGNVLKTPYIPFEGEDAKKFNASPEEMRDILISFQKAKSEVIFEGFEICNRLESVKCVTNGDLHISYEHSINLGQNLEELVKYNLILTEQARDKYKF